MPMHELAGKPAPYQLLVNVPRLVSAYYTQHPDPENPAQRVAFGTSGHRGSSLENSFNEDHILAISQAICEYRREQGIDGPLFIGMDTHALSEPALATALEVFAANGVDVMIQTGRGYTPTPVISHAILTYNQGRSAGLADGVVITPSHNPPDDGGFKYNPPSGGPADTETTSAHPGSGQRVPRRRLGRRSNACPLSKALQAGHARQHDYITPYVARSGKRHRHGGHRRGRAQDRRGPHGRRGRRLLGAHRRTLRAGHRGGQPAASIPTFSFMTVDKDGKIRMDCSSPYAMAGLIGLKDRFDIAFGNDPDYDRHGIVTRSAGLMNPNHYLAVAIWYLFQNRPGWRGRRGGRQDPGVQLHDRPGGRAPGPPAGARCRWGSSGLWTGCWTARYGFGGEESAGASFLRKDGTVWTTDKDGIIMDLLAAEITAVTGRDPGEHYRGTGSPVRQPRLRAHRRAGHAGAKGGASRPLAGHGRRPKSWPGEPITGQAHPRPGQRRAHRRAQGRDRKRLVCRPALGHRGHLQDLCREFSGRNTWPPSRKRRNRSSAGHSRRQRMMHPDRTVGYLTERTIPVGCILMIRST